ncbi:ribosomal protein S7 [Hypoxylon cercidicola]|nr:ribosomal protein S7 [Hypoxylon cercidicola]
MSCKLTPWGASVVRNLSIRTRRPTTSALRASHRERQPMQQTPFLITRRGLSDDLISRPPPPPPPPEQLPKTPEESVETQNIKTPEVFAPNFLNAEAIAALEKAAAGEDIYEDDRSGLRFDRPEPVGRGNQLQDRYHPVVDQITKLLMKDGKLSKAQRNMSLILNYLRTTPAPKVSPLRPLLPGSPPPDQLPLNPLLYLTLAIDSVAPLVRIRAIKGAAGGGAALELPEPMAVRARRRVAVIWILDAVRRKRSTGSGRAQFAARFAQEVVAVVEGRSGVWDRRNQVHKVGTAARANLLHPKVVGRKR